MRIIFLCLLFITAILSLKTQLRTQTKRAELTFQCESTMGPQSPHDACIQFDSDKYHWCKGILICQSGKLTRKETCALADPPYTEIQLPDVKDEICDEEEFKQI